MKSLFSTHRDTTAVSTTFVSERETAKLTEMLEIAIKDLERVSGGAAAAVAKGTGCCCCHHLA